jgi:membrane protein
VNKKKRRTPRDWRDRLRIWSQSYSPPGFKGVSLYDTFTFVWREARKDNLMTRANSVSFSLFLALFPAIIFLFTLLPLIPIIKDYTSMLSSNLSTVLPRSAHTYIFGIIDDLTSIKRDGLLSLGAFLALWFSSNGMLNLMKGFDKAYEDTFHDRHWIKDRLIAIMLTVIISVLLIVSLVLVVLESRAIDYLDNHFEIHATALWLIGVFNKMFAVFIVYVGITIIYTFGPAMYRRIPFINIGAITATVFSILSSIVFSSFINNFNRFNEVYGSLGALMVTMLWIQLNVFIILVGFELNASIAIHRTAKWRRRLTQGK